MNLCHLKLNPLKVHLNIRLKLGGLLSLFLKKIKSSPKQPLIGRMKEPYITI